MISLKLRGLLILKRVAGRRSWSCTLATALAVVGKILPDIGTGAVQVWFRRCQALWRVFVSHPSKWVTLLTYLSIDLGAQAQARVSVCAALSPQPGL